jgi:hypothetical protein
MSSNAQTPSLRDIREDLKARLRDAVANRDLHAGKAQEYGKEVDVLTQLLDREEARFVAQKAAQAPTPKEPDEPLADFLLKALRTRPMNKSDLREQATRAGYAGDGRSIHLTVVNLSRANRVKELPHGVFALADSARRL